MRTVSTTFLILFLSCTLLGQAQWRYQRSIPFPASDTSYVQPFLCTVTEGGRLYVISSSLTNASARNAVWYADSNDTEMKKLVDYALTGDSDTLTGNIGALRGITSIGDNVLVNASVPYPRTKPNTVGAMFYYPNGDTMQVRKYGFYFSNAGHGTYHHGASMTKDSVVIACVSSGAAGGGPRLRSYNFSSANPTPAVGSWSTETEIELNVQHTAGADIIRDVALVPGGDYDTSITPIYTSRNSSPNVSTGGIAVWTGGTQLAMGQIVNQAYVGYTSSRISDATGLLSFSPAVANGITVDKSGYLWVAGIDSTKRWVKAFDVSGILASEVADLPSQNNQDGFSADPSGAPMIAPVDVALTADGLTAYVPDAVAQVVYQFKYTTATSVEPAPQVPQEFTLYQNYPNPFNPSTIIAFTLPQSMKVRLTVSNLIGQTVATLADGVMPAGNHHRFFTGDNLPSGQYIYTLTTPEGSVSRSMTLVK